MTSHGAPVQILRVEPKSKCRRSAAYMWPAACPRNGPITAGARLGIQAHPRVSWPDAGRCRWRAQHHDVRRRNLGPRFAWCTRPFMHAVFAWKVHDIKAHSWGECWSEPYRSDPSTLHHYRVTHWHDSGILVYMINVRQDTFLWNCSSYCRWQRWDYLLISCRKWSKTVTTV